jgi:Brp/Blh family beta-carotene 15,15'-monooxygenase
VKGWLLQSWPRAAALGSGALLLALPTSHATLLFSVVTVTLGFWHGATDAALLLRGEQALARTAAYAGAAAAAALALLAFPQAQLPVLLAASVLHFGQRAEPASPLERVLHATVPLACPWWLQQPALQEALALLAIDLSGWGPAVWRLIAVAAAVAGAVALAQGVLRRRWPLGATGTADLAAAAALFALLPPLAAFALWFAWLHCLPHLMVVGRAATSAAGLAAAAAAVALCWAAVPAWHGATGTPWSAAGVAQAALLVTTAVSVPHLVLVGAWYRSR